MNRRNQILSGILVVQLVLTAIVLLWQRPTASAGTGESLFPGVEADLITALTITGGDGQSIRLAKRSGAWVLPEADDYPGQADKVKPLLAKIVGLKAERLITQTPGSHKRLKVADDEFERRIEFELADGTRHTLYLGASPTFRATHVRAGGQDEVYLASDLSAQEAGVEATAWVDRTYLDVPQDQIVAVTLENGNGRFEFVKEGDTWAMKGLAEGETLDEGQVTTLVNKARFTPLLRPLGKEEQAAYGMQDPQAIVTIQTAGDQGDKTYVLWIGAQDPADNSYVVKSSASDYYVRVTEFSVQDFVEKAREDFLAQPPTPTPEATGEATPEATPEGQ